MPLPYPPPVEPAGGSWAADLVRRTAALVVVCDADLTVVDANPAMAEAAGVALEALVGRPAREVMAAAREGRELEHALRAVELTGETRAHEHPLPARPAALDSRRSIAWASCVLRREPLALASVGVDVTAVRSLADDALARATTDELTGLPNRGHLLQLLERETGSGASVLFCDLNGFKAVNDTFGHAVGDAVIVEVARRLRRAVRGEDVVGRLGGDEFVIIAPPHPTSSAEGLSRRVIGAMRQPILIGRVVVVVGVSVGVSVMAPGRTAADVLHEADARMYSAKSLQTTGGGRVGTAGGEVLRTGAGEGPRP